jgi:hypothetical protein
MFCLEICRVNFPRNKILGGKFTRNISLSKTLLQKTSKFNQVIFIRNEYYFLNYYEQIDFIKKRLNFDVSNLTDIKARKTIATTAFYMYRVLLKVVQIF